MEGGSRFPTLPSSFVTPDEMTSKSLLCSSRLSSARGRPCAGTPMAESSTCVVMGDRRGAPDELAVSCWVWKGENNEGRDEPRQLEFEANLSTMQLR